MHIRKLRRTDVPAAMALSTGAGWNQVAADWRRLLALAPDGYWGGHVDGGLVATATALAYGRDLAWIGMVLVHPDHRRRGHERALFEHALRQARTGGAAAVGLDATEAGRPLYRQYGFIDVTPMRRPAAPHGLPRSGGSPPERTPRQRERWTAGPTASTVPRCSPTCSGRPT